MIIRSPIFRLKLPKEGKPGKGLKIGQPHPIKGQARLNALARNAVPPGKMLNPYGKFGNTQRSRYRLGDRDHMAFRGEALKRNRKRKRVQLRERKRVALEMHELQQLARENAVDAMKTLINISQDERAPHPSRIAASAVILERGYGKSSQVTMSASLTSEKSKDLTGDELARRIDKTLKRVEELTTRAPEAPKSKNRPNDLRKLH